MQERSFRALLSRQGRKGGGKGAAGPDDADVSAEGMAGARLPAAELAREPLARAPILIEHRPAARPVELAPAVARMLLGQGPRANEARLELRGGALGGAVLHCVSEGGAIEVRMGAPSEPARLALARVIDQVGHRLRSRGIVMRAGRDLDTDSRDRGRGGGARQGP